MSGDGGTHLTAPDREAELLATLRRADDPEWPERPRDYDRSRAGALLDTLVARLDADFATCCAAEWDTQDSSEYGRVTVPAEATVCGTRIVVCLSKFGSLALICADNPGAFLCTAEAQAEGELDPADLARVDQALTGLGYTIVPEELIEQDYDGPTPLPSFVHRPSWWHRFFGTC